MSNLPDSKTLLGEALRHRRQQAGLSQFELAQRASVSTVTILRMERPNYLPTLRVLKLVESALENAESDR